MLISPFSAIPSWQGYEYQGHIALYIALKEIKKLLSSDRSLINDRILEVEGKEDFSIKNNERYLSLHQVKRGAVKLDNDGKKDKFSFVISLLQYEAREGFYHILPSKSIPNNFIESTFDHIVNLQTELSKKVKLKSEVQKDDFDNYIMTHKISQNSKKGSLYDILKYVCDGKTDKEYVIKSIKIIKTRLEEYIQKLKPDGNLLNDESFISKYEPSFNNSIELKEDSYRIINEILETERPDWNFLDENYARFIYYKLYINLKTLIETDFINNPKNKEGSTFNFSEILELIIKDYKGESNSVDYQYYLVWKSIKEMYENFPQKDTNACSVKICNDCKNQSICNLFKQIKILSEKEKESLNIFLYQIMLEKPELNKLNNLPSDNLINRLLIRLLKEIDILKLGENNIIQAQKNGLIYRLTLDSCGEISEFDQKLQKNISFNNENSLFIYESDVLITDQLKENLFVYNSIDTNVLRAQEYKELEGISSSSIEELKKDCNKYKVIRLIDRKSVKEELSDE